nr:MAG TPA: hypothetical protein [Caudoviricetes sp.]
MACYFIFPPTFFYFIFLENFFMKFCKNYYKIRENIKKRL